MSLNNPPIVLLAAGHGTRPDGSFDNGAVNPNDKTKEHDLNLQVMHYAETEMKKYHCQVMTDTNLLGFAHEPNWSQLIKDLQAKNLTPDIVVEIHHDSYNAKAAGFGILPKTVFNSRITKLAQFITDEYHNNDLATKPNYVDVRGLGLLKVIKYPTLIWECNVTVGTSGDILQKRGECIARGIAKWLNLIATPVGAPITQDTTEKVRVFLGLPAQGGMDGDYTKAVIAWKVKNKFYPSIVLEGYHLKLMGIQ